MTTRLTKINGMPSGNDYWYLGWIGRLFNNTIVNGEKVIEARVSPMQYITDQRYIKKGQIDWRKSTSVYISIAALPYLEMGSIWQKGKIVSSQNIIDEKITLNFSKSNTSIIKAHDLWFPKLESQSGNDKSKLLNSPIFKISSPDQNKTFYIPTFEVFRFFYGINSPFIRNIFEPNLNINVNQFGIFSKFIKSIKRGNWSTSKQKYDYISVDLTKYAYNLDAPILVKYALSPIAKEELARVIKSIAAQSNQDPDSIFITARPPFDDNATLSMSTRPLPFLGDNHFLVEKILHCEHRRTFDLLYFDRENNSKKADGDMLRPYGNDFITDYKTEIDHKDKTKSITSKKYSNTKISTTHLKCQSDRFSELNDITIVEIPKEKQTHHANPNALIAEEPDYNDITANQNRDQNSTTGLVDFMQDDQKEDEKQKLTLFNTLDVLIEMEKLYSELKVNIIPCRVENKNLIVIDNTLLNNVPIFRTRKYNLVRKWCLNENGFHKYRLILSAHIKFNCFNVYLLDVERLLPSDSLSAILVSKISNPEDELETSDLEKLIKMMEDCSGSPRWPHDEDIDHLDTKRFNHSLKFQDSPIDAAKHLFQVLSSFLEQNRHIIPLGQNYFESIETARYETNNMPNEPLSDEELHYYQNIDYSTS